MVPARGDDQHRVHATPQQRGDQLALELGILLARARDQQVAARASRLLHGLGDGGVEGIRDVLDDQAERGGGATMAQAPREVVALKAEGGNRGDHARGGLVRDAGLVVYHARDGLQAHAGFFGNIPHRWPRRSQSHLTLVLMTTLSDNVVSSQREYASPDVRVKCLPRPPPGPPAIGRARRPRRPRAVTRRLRTPRPPRRPRREAGPRRQQGMRRVPP